MMYTLRTLTIIPGQQANTLVKYKIVAYDNAGNHYVEDNNGQYYAYTVISESSSIPLTILLSTAIIFGIIVIFLVRRKIPKKKHINKSYSL